MRRLFVGAALRGRTKLNGSDFRADRGNFWRAVTFGHIIYKLKSVNQSSPRG